MWRFTPPRWLYDLILVLALLLGPWWFFTLLIAIGVPLYQRFFEAPLGMLIFDLSYGWPGVGWAGWQFWPTVVVAFWFWLWPHWRRRIYVV